ncbi:MAG: F420-0--gamma-glutamyl ligase [Clostridia bacterium]|jgi:F420-0:gamma-glutamyl ligase-like protein|nr:F420-0--gamma-glutamyl ligase [Clostridia bacterium]
MEFLANEGRNVEIEVNGEKYLRHAIKTRFVKQGDDYIDVIKEYVSDIYEPGDFISISEKIISMCQNRVVRREDLKVGFWAKFLSRFASRTKAGVGVGESLKMQYAINKVGLLKVLWASFLSAVTKLFGIKGVFYKVVGQEVSGLDGLCYGHVWKEYEDIGIEIPENPTGVCNEIQEKLGISCMIVDANDLGQEILGKSDDIKLEEKDLVSIIRDNPAGQGRSQTPIILIRKCNKEMEKCTEEKGENAQNMQDAE